MGEFSGKNIKKVKPCKKKMYKQGQIVLCTNLNNLQLTGITTDYLQNQKFKRSEENLE